MKKLLGAASALALVAFAGSAMAAGDTASNTAPVNATIIRPIAVASAGSLSFGTIVKPSTGAGSVSVSTSNVRNVSGTGAIGLASTPSSVPTFTISGEGGQAFTLAIDPTVTLTGSVSGSLTVTTSNDAGCTSACSLSGGLGDVADGSKAVKVGGSFPFDDTTATGTYSGTLHVSATYN